MLGDHASAVAAYREALSRDPAFGEALYGLAISLRRLGRRDEARKVSARFEEIHRTESAFLRRANELDQAVRRSSDDASVALRAAQLHFERGDDDRVQHYAWVALRRDAGCIAARLVLARSFARSGRFTEAAAQYQRVLLQDRENENAAAELRALIDRKGAR
jgi:Flp pilus assembly protein TadD